MSRAIKTTVAAAGVALVAAMGAAPAAANDLTFFTGPTGGSWYPLGGALKSIWENAIPGTHVEIRPGAGLINMQAIETRRGQIGFGNMPSTVDALRGIGEGITEPYENNCHIASLYPQISQMVVRADDGITSWEDMRGKRFATLPPGNTTAVVAEMLFSIVGMDMEDDVSSMNYANTSDQANMFKDGQIDASFLITTQGAGAILDMANSRQIAMLDVPDDMLEKLTEINPGFTRYVIPQNVYPGLTQDNHTVQFPAHVLVSCELDDDLVYEMTAAMVDALPELRSVNAVFDSVEMEDMGAPVAVKWHPGAARYFEDNGISVN